jgi:hypothetical protein
MALSAINKANFLFLAVLLLILGAHLYKLILFDSNKNLEFGWYPHEKWGAGPMRWSWRRARLVAKAKTDLLGIIVYNHPNMPSEPAGLLLRLCLDGKELDKVHLGKGVFRGLYYYVPGIKGREITLDLDVGRTFNLYKQKLGTDIRDLGVALSPLSFLEIPPPDGIGVYGWEEWNEPGLEIAHNGRVRVRWTGRRATLLTDQFMSANHVYCKLLHPDIKERPVTLSILGDSGPLLELNIAHNEWRSLAFLKEKLRGSDTVTFSLSRTWNPKEYGFSEDSRDLGLALMMQ